MSVLNRNNKFKDLYWLLNYKLANKATNIVESKNNAGIKRCYELLTLTSRSFAGVIMQLDGEIRLAICIFYLVLRGLDTVEDDMTLDNGRKIKVLGDFHNIIYQAGWNFNESGQNEKDGFLLKEFHVVIEQFLLLKKEYQVVIKDITQRMAHGMVYYAEYDIETVKDWDKYCHYVAGLVGIGLSKLFSASGLEEESLGESEDLSNSMGLFLQKTNIIRDYLEDVEDGRVFWPREIWKKHSLNGKICDFKESYKTNNSIVLKQQQMALDCLNELINNALKHIQDVFTYLCKLSNKSIFQFCAIPQVMAIATISKCYNNLNIFTGVVKINKGLAVEMMMQSNNMEYVYKVFHAGLSEISSKSIQGLSKNALQLSKSRDYMLEKDTDLSLKTYHEAEANILDLKMLIIKLTSQDFDQIMHASSIMSLALSSPLLQCIVGVLVAVCFLLLMDITHNVKS